MGSSSLNLPSSQIDIAVTATIGLVIEYIRNNVSLVIGASFSITRWPIMLANLVNPLIVGRILGAEAVGLVALAKRLLLVFGFVADVAWRLAIPLLPKFRDKPEQLSLLISRACTLQVFGIGAPLFVFCLIGTVIVEHLLGVRWLPAMDVMPLMAIVLLGQSMFQIKESALLLFRRNSSLAAFYSLHLVILATGTWFFSEEYGLIGIGLAMIVALPSYAIVNYLLSSLVPPRPYAGFIWFAVFSALILATIVPGPWSQMLVLAAAIGAFRKEARMEFVEEVRTVMPILLDMFRRKAAPSV